MQVNEWTKCPVYQIPGNEEVLDPQLGIDA